MDQPPPQADATPSPPPSRDTPPRLRAGRSWSAIIVFAVVAMAILVGDLALKYVSFRTVAGVPVQLDPAHPGAGIPLHDPVEVVPYILSLRLTANTGAVFGSMAGWRWVFVVITFIAVAVIFRVFWRSRADAWVFHLGLALILGGALGNLYDRLRYSAVRDMLWLFPETRLWPWLFNLADAALMVGVGLVILMMWLNEMRPRNAEATPH
ncbi:signal peptidase II [Phycisphaerales bacterium AB-hyl4]|uniref:Lipoprotein signal peptidase n=1 Tax=Natronomicrosphaera hydrolytica TaxID=3242702 RepID=A0ABV4U1S7_9BACT